MKTPINVQTALVIGSGPITISQGAEFDYAGTQACRALREEGIRVVLVNSNPATIMTDDGVADVTYIEPLTIDVLKNVIERERPEGVLATLGGQTALNLAVALSDAGVLQEYGVRVLGTPVEAIRTAENRDFFKRLLQNMDLPTPISRAVTSAADAFTLVEELGLPVIVRPAFTLGGTGSGVARTAQELGHVVENGIISSPIRQVLVEQYLEGWKEIEFEVIRDGADTCITVCAMENFDPLGIHTGDSIVVAPTQTLSDQEYQRLRTVAIRIIRALGIEGGCNIQFAVASDSPNFYVIEVNPRVSRSSALASKATGYPIARVAAKIAVGKRLDEITNEVTGKTVAAFEPALDYVVVKIPRWPFDKFPLADRALGTQMKATGEVMAIDRTFESALQKAMRALELELSQTAPKPSYDSHYAELQPTDLRLWHLFQAIRRDCSDDALQAIQIATSIDHWFLAKVRRIVLLERRLETELMTSNLLRQAKRMGFSDRHIAESAGQSIRLLGMDGIEVVTAQTVHDLRVKWGILPTYKMVDTCAAEFAAQTPYFYSTYEQENEAEPLPGAKAVVLGSGPIRIGQGIEFDYCSVRAAQELRDVGVRSIMVNSNPETVSTDFDMSDRLYFEPLDAESVLAILENEGASENHLPPTVVQFGGQTAIGLADPLEKAGVPILGTSVDSIDRAEDRRRFDALMEELGVPRPRGAAVRTVSDAVATASEIGYPVLVRPSYVLGGRAMEIVRTEEALERYVTRVVEQFGEHPILIDRYLLGREVEVDALCDGQDVLIPGIMEHIERAGVHSGDSFAVYPPRSLTPEESAAVARYTCEIAKALGVRGLMNAQFVLTEPTDEPGGNVYVLEVNPRASRTVPFLSKVTGVPMVAIATRIMLGRSLAAQGYAGLPGNVWPTQPLVAVKGPVFSMAKIIGAEPALGPEMRSTGEAMGVDRDYGAALLKALIAAGIQIPSSKGTALVSIADRDKVDAIPLLRTLARAGYRLISTEGTATFARTLGIPDLKVEQVNHSDNSAIDRIRSHDVHLVINTVTGGDRNFPSAQGHQDGFEIRRAAVEVGIPCFTSLDTALAVVQAMCDPHEYLILPLVQYRSTGTPG